MVVVELIEPKLQRNQGGVRGRREVWNFQYSASARVILSACVLRCGYNITEIVLTTRDGRDQASRPKRREKRGET